MAAPVCAGCAVRLIKTLAKSEGLVDTKRPRRCGSLLRRPVPAGVLRCVRVALVPRLLDPHKRAVCAPTPRAPALRPPRQPAPVVVPDPPVFELVDDESDAVRRISTMRFKFHAEERSRWHGSRYVICLSEAIVGM